MKKTFYLLPVFITVLCLTQSRTAKADASGGGELVYEWIADSTYRFILKFDRDCAADTAPATFPLCMYSSCTGSTSSTTMSRMFNTPTTYPYGCAANKTQCDSPASLIRGFQTWWYSAIVTIPQSCTDWKFYTYGGHRNNAVNIQNATTTNLYLECTFDNLHFQGNSSPYFSIHSFLSTCMGNSFGNGYNAAAIDPDNDSLVTELIMPLTGVTHCGDIPVNANFPAAATAYSLSTNPIQSNNTFSLNPSTGNMFFTPTQAGNNVLDIRVKEYRNNVLVGTTMREIQIQILPCSFPAIDLQLDTNSITGANHIKDTLITCPNQQIHFCFSAKSSDTNSVLIGEDNHVYGMPGATVSYTTQRTDSVRGCLTWTPTSLYDTAKRSLTFTVIDSGCHFGWPLQYYYAKTFYVMVVPHTHIYTDTSICAGDSILLKGIGGGTYTWNVLSGTVGSLSCPTCSNTWAKPAATTQYTLNTTGNASCSYVNDTVTVNVIPKVNPVVTITASPDTNFQKGTAVNFTANTTGGATMLSYTWMKNSSKVLGITSGTYNNANAKDNDSVYCELHVFDQCAFPADTFSNTLVLHEFDTTNGIEPVNCADRNFKLYPNPARSSVVLSTSGLNSQDAIVVIVNASGQTLYSDKWRKEEGKKEVSVSSLADGNYLILINIGGKINSIPFSIKH